MSDPYRLLRNPLDQVSRRALEAAIADEPPMDAKASVWQAIGLAVPAVGVGLGATASTGAATTSKGPSVGNTLTRKAVTRLHETGVAGVGARGPLMGTSWLFKAVTAGVGIGLVVNAAMLIPRVASFTAHESPATAATATIASPPPGERPLLRVLPPHPPAAMHSGAEPVVSGALATPLEPATPETRVPAPMRSNDVTTSSVPTPRGAVPQPTADTLREESQLLVRVRQALNAPDPSRALHLIAEHRRVFGAGALTQERDVMEVQALVQLGHVQEAKARATAFLQRYPTSPHGDKMRAITER